MGLVIASIGLGAWILVTGMLGAMLYALIVIGILPDWIIAIALVIILALGMIGDVMVQWVRDEIREYKLRKKFN